MQQADTEDQLNQRPAHRPSKDETVYNNKEDVNTSRPVGNSVKAALRRLRKDRLDIHARVLSGELSANAGMIEAGFRKKQPSKKRSALDRLHTAWREASPEERQTFLTEVDPGRARGVWPNS